MSRANKYQEKACTSPGGSIAACSYGTIASDWKEKGIKIFWILAVGLVDIRCFFARQGFNVSVFDLSIEATGHLREGAQKYLTFCSKETWPFKDSGHPKLDENTVIQTDEGPEKDVRTNPLNAAFIYDKIVAFIK